MENNCANITTCGMQPPELSDSAIIRSEELPLSDALYIAIMFIEAFSKHSECYRPSDCLKAAKMLRKLYDCLYGKKNFSVVL